MLFAFNLGFRLPVYLNMATVEWLKRAGGRLQKCSGRFNPGKPAYSYATVPEEGGNKK